MGWRGPLARAAFDALIFGRYPVFLMASALPVGELFILGFQGYTVPPWLRAFAERFGLGGVILFDYDVASRCYVRNIRDAAQLRTLCAELAALPSAPMVFVDQEGGKVRRLKESLGFAPLPSAKAFNRLPPAEKTALAARSYGELKALGISWNLAPVIDLDLNPHNPDIGAVERSYSDQPDQVRENVTVLAQAAREVGLGLCLKHYPGMGGATTNNHDQLTDISATLSEEQLALFYELAPLLPGAAVLVAHGLVRQWEPGQPVSMSSSALGQLRGVLPDVLLISDDLQMQGLQRLMSTEQACHRGLAAGLDLLLMGNNLMDESSACETIAAGLAQAAQEDALLINRIHKALERVYSKKRSFGAEEPSLQRLGKNRQKSINP